MQRAGRLIRKLNNCVTPEELARAAWPAAAGKTIAAHTAVASLVRTCLVVDVEDALWQKQLLPLEGYILKNFREIVGAGIVEEIYFRVRALRPLPQREERSARPSQVSAQDEAQSIQDPILRALYKRSRRKAWA